MQALERRALYNLLRMNWLSDPSLSVEPWQVEDYRALPLIDLFERLKIFQIQLERMSFIAYADECDSPEDLTDHLIGESEFKPQEEDQIYLIVFELWRRLMSEKPSLSILCNELDYQIYLYDQEQSENPLALPDALIHFAQILAENVDEGIPPKKVFNLISAYCANDIETFLYDFIAQQIDEGNESYAQELLDDFEPYLSDNKWFILLRVRLCEHTNNHKIMQKLLGKLFEEHLKENDVDFNLELLSFLSERGDPSAFRIIIQRTTPFLEREEEFQDLLGIGLEYYRRLDQVHHETVLQAVLEKRSNIPLENPLHDQDPDRVAFVKLFV